MSAESSETLESHPVDSGLENGPPSGRAEIDTSAPFESVKEAATRFGGMGFWKPVSHNKPSENASENDSEMVDIVKVEEHAAQLARDLVIKERETLDVLKELEATKNTVEELKLKLQKEAAEINAALKENPRVNVVAEGKNESDSDVRQRGNDGLDLCPSEAPGLILLELKQAKLNLTRTTNDLADIRATVDVYNKKIEKERASLEKTRLRLTSNTSKISGLEEELNQTRQRKEEMAKDAGAHEPLDITRELQKLSSETEQFKKVGEAARSEVVRTMSEIEQTKTRIRTAEIRLVAAKKMKEAARASEAVALAEIKALSKAENKENEIVTLTFEEYSSLVSKAREAEEACKGRIANATLQVNEANMSKTEILREVELATEEVKTSKKALEEALSRVEAANRGKLAVEEALRVWRSEHSNKRRSINNSTKFKNSHPSAYRRESARMVDLNGLDLISEDMKPVLKPTLSIGQILSRKLLLTEDYENGTMLTEKSTGKRKVSLAQMLGKPNGDQPKKSGKENDELPAKRKKFGIARISLLVMKQRKKKQNANSILSSV